MKKRDDRTLSLFDAIETGGVRVELPGRRLLDPTFCTHKIELPTETDWGKPYGVRMTWTCRDCGRVRGRFGGAV